MYEFPIELWIKIFESLSTVEWHVLRMVCRDFRAVAQPSRFKSVKLCGKTETLRLVNEHPELVDLIHDLTLNFIGDVYTDALSYPSLSEIVKFTALRTLCLQGVHVTSSSYAALQKLSQLCEVCYSSCVLDEGLADADPTKWPTTLSNVNIQYTPSMMGWTSFLPTTVVSFGLELNHAKYGDGDGFIAPEEIILAEILETPWYWNFTELNFELVMPNNIIPFLVSCPHVLRITLASLTYPRASPLADLPPTALPRLEYFRGSSKYAEYVVPGRPVHTCDIEASFEGLHTPQFLSGITPTTLVARYNRSWSWEADSGAVTNSPPLDFSRGLFEHVPSTVRRLRLSERRYEHHSGSEWLSALSKLRMPDLHVLELSGVSVPHKLQVAFVEKDASAISQSLGKVVFEPYTKSDNGRTTWLGTRGNWVPYFKK